MTMPERLPMALLLRFKMNRVRHVPGEQLRQGHTGCDREKRVVVAAMIFWLKTKGPIEGGSLGIQAFGAVGTLTRPNCPMPNWSACAVEAHEGRGTA